MSYTILRSGTLESRREASAWTPASVASHDSTWLGSSLGADASAIAAWATALGAARTLAQGTGANQPAVVTSGGKKAARFDGADDWLSVALTLAQPCTVAVALNVRSVAAGNKRYLDSTDRLLFGTGAVGGYQAYAGSTILNGSAAAAGTQVWIVTFDGAAFSIEVDGVESLTGDPGTAGTGGTLYLGAADAGATEPAPIDVFALSLFTAALSAGVKSLLLAYLQSQTG